LRVSAAFPSSSPPAGVLPRYTGCTAVAASTNIDNRGAKFQQQWRGRILEWSAPERRAMILLTQELPHATSDEALRKFDKAWAAWDKKAARDPKVKRNIASMPQLQIKTRSGS